MGKRTLFITTSNPPVPPMLRHVSTDWIVTTDPSDPASTIYQSLNDTINRLTLRIELPDDPNTTQYYIQYRRHYDIGSRSPWYIETILLCSQGNYIIPPTITDITITSTDITIQTAPYTDRHNLPHDRSDWIITTPYGLPIYQSLNDTVNKTSISIPRSVFRRPPNTTYDIRVRFIDSLGIKSLFTTRPITV